MFWVLQDQGASRRMAACHVPLDLGGADGDGAPRQPAAGARSPPRRAAPAGYFPDAAAAVVAVVVVVFFGYYTM